MLRGRIKGSAVLLRRWRSPEAFGGVVPCVLFRVPPEVVLDIQERVRGEGVEEPNGVRTGIADPVIG